MSMLTGIMPMQFLLGQTVGITAITTTAGIILTTIAEATDILIAMDGVIHIVAGALARIITALTTHGDITTLTIIIIITATVTMVGIMAILITTDQVLTMPKIMGRVEAPVAVCVHQRPTTEALHG